MPGFQINPVVYFSVANPMHSIALHRLVAWFSETIDGKSGEAKGTIA